jgi:hypothetical protein
MTRLESRAILKHRVESKATVSITYPNYSDQRIALERTIVEFLAKALNQQSFPPNTFSARCKCFTELRVSAE